MGLLLFALILAAYQPAWHGGFLFEDEIFARDNPLLTASDGLWRIWFTLESPSQYFPLTHSLFLVQRALWGGGTTGYHFLNIILHASIALILWRLLRRLEIPGAWFAAALFALHPVQAESVAQISELKNVLSGLFFVAALYFWMFYTEKGESRAWIFAFLCALFALAAKTTACVLPVPLLLVLWWRRKPLTNRTTWFAVAPFIIVSGLAALVAYDWEQAHNTSTLVDVRTGLIERGLIASRAIFFYLGKLAWPSGLTFNYPRWSISRWHAQDYLWPGALLLLIAVIMTLRRRLGRGPEVALLFFVGVLSPLLGLVAIYSFRYSFVADHYQYLACIGPLALFAAAVDRLLRDRGRLALFVPLLIVAVLLGLTWNQAHAYANAEALWTDTIRRNSGSWMAENNYGTVLLERGAKREALIHFERAEQLGSGKSEIDRNLGQCLLELQEPREARPYLEKAASADPRDGRARRDLARAFLQLGQPEEALTKANEAISVDPRDAKAHVVLASILIQQGRAEDASAQLQTAISLKPDDVEAQTQMANMALQLGHHREASEILERILAQKPDDPDALKNYAWILATAPEKSLRDGDRAIALAQRAAAKAPQSPFIQATLAAAYAEAGHFPEATTVAGQALAVAETNHLTSLAELLRKEMALFESGQPARDVRVLHQ
jgi:tetratricopeptide (TPR) repeat protein